MKKFTAGLLLLFLFLMPVQAQTEALIPGGQIIGIKLGNPMTVAAFEQHSSPARDAGMQVGDRITHINNIKVDSLEQIRRVIKDLDGPVEVRYVRNGVDNTLSVTPRSGLLGVYMKKSVTGVGTVTYYDPDTGTFGALGHGVNDSGGNLLAMDTGAAFDANVVSVQPGTVGEPGRLLGALRADGQLGQLSKNTPQGVFGSVDSFPQTAPMEIGHAHTGDAVIRCTIKGRELQEYSVKILKIYPSERENSRNMLIQITDPTLLTTTGGIVQGMSGSPLLQDGRIVGAVTHVLVNDPTMGYAIFIENMLEAAG